MNQYVFKQPQQETFYKSGVRGFAYSMQALTGKTEFLIIETEHGHETAIIEKECDFSYFVLAGSGYFLINDTKEACVAGDLVVIPAGTKFTYKGNLKMLLNVTPPFFPEQEEVFDM